MIMTASDTQLLEWTADRLVLVHGDPKDVDYVLALRELAKRLDGKDTIINGLAERCAGQSELLSQRAGRTTTPTVRKTFPVATGVLDYFPDAIKAIANCSYVGNQQHNPGSQLHWDRSTSTDEADAMIRHFIERGTVDSDGVRHSTKVAWRALALLQKELEAEATKSQEQSSNDAMMAL